MIRKVMIVITEYDQPEGEKPLQVSSSLWLKTKQEKDTEPMNVGNAGITAGRLMKQMIELDRKRSER